ncbi:TRAP transporter large permease subunit [Actinoallomurus iriomotensis]|uniref:Gluconate:proton symporter n=1 Tax=Actinoallomurus iriomotensis TaxID=478107 RepID=A0A9W6W036_9ACTN|nr:TRAP transporter large permease subunit [Actinoallomurus iriomotensis]GLY85357.1 gluconate:proton symporter [Actinoallomurus iriomotensis]
MSTTTPAENTAAAPEKHDRRLPMIATGAFAVALVIGIVIAVGGAKAGLWGLIPIFLYAVLALFGVDVVLATAGALIVAAVMTRTGPIPLGAQMATSLGSLVAVIGVIILLGSALGQVTQETGAAQALIKFVMGRIGLNTRTRVQIGVMVSSLIIVGALGTLAGGNAILAPIIIPIAARTGWRPPAVAAMLHAAGAAGLMTGPFTPPVVTIMAATKLSYGTYLLHAGLPVAAVTIVTGFFMARWIQRHTDQEYTAADAADNTAETERPGARRAALVLALVLLALAIYGIAEKAAYSYALVVMIVTAVATGLAGGLAPKKILDAMYTGAARLIWLFLLFWMLDPMLTLIGKTGAFDAVFADLKPVLSHAGPWVFLMLVVFLGYLHAVPGAAVAQVVLVNKLFGPVGAALGVAPAVWAVALLGTSQVDQLGPLPGADMIGQMGLARSSSLRMMLFNGWAIIVTNTALFALLFLVLT